MPHDTLAKRYEKSLSCTAATARFFRRGADALLGYCAEQGYDLPEGRVPASLLRDFARAHEPERRVLRGAVGLCWWLRSHGVRLPSMDDPGLELLNQAQLGVFMTVASEFAEPYGTFFQLLTLTQLAASDLVGMRLCDVHRDEQGKALFLRTEADGQSSELILSDRARALLTAYLDGWRADLEDAAAHEDSAPLFVSQGSRPPAASTLTRKLQAIQDAAGLPDFRISALRNLPVPLEPGQVVEPEEPILPQESSVETASDASNAVPPEGGRYLHAVQEPSERLDEVAAEVTLAGPPEPPRVAELGEVSGRKTPGASSSPGREIRRMLPLRGVVYIKKRLDAGNTAYVGRYNIADVGEDEAIEPFIGRYLVPELGPGEYLVYDHARAVSPIHSFRFLERPSAKSAPSSADSRLADVRPVGASSGVALNTANYQDVYLAVRREEEARRRDQELQQTLKDLREENKRLRQEVALMRRERELASPVGPVGVGPLPPLPVPEDPLKAVYLDAVRRNQEIVDELIKKNLGMSGEPSDADQFERLVRLANGPLGRLLESTLANRGGKGGGRPSGMPAPWAQRGAAPSSSRPRSARGVADAGRHEDTARSKETRGPSGRAAPPEASQEEAVVPRELPAAAIPFLEKIERAESEEELVQNLVRALAVLHLRPEWQADIQGVFQSIAMDRAEEALEAAWSLLRELVEDGHLTDGAARAVVMTVHESWDELRGRAIELAQTAAKRAQAGAE